MELITKLDDERFSHIKMSPTNLDVELLVDSLRVALERIEVILPSARLYNKVRAERDALRGQLCRARDVEGIATVIIQTYESLAFEASKDEEFRKIFVRDARRIVDWVSSTSPCPHEARIRELEEAIRRIYATQMYEGRKKESGVSVEMVSAILDAAALAGCREGHNEF